MAHTPGPWEARPSDGQILLNGSNAYGIQEIFNEQGGFNPDDIRLIAAAPDLLAALLDIITCAHISMPYGGWAYCISDDRIDAAFAAINKAEGGGE